MTVPTRASSNLSHQLTVHKSWASITRTRSSKMTEPRGKGDVTDYEKTLHTCCILYTAYLFVNKTIQCPVSVDLDSIT
jgi:precorrin-4 methylase